MEDFQPKSNQSGSLRLLLLPIGISALLVVALIIS
jgi:hypothetical protein